MGNWFSGLKSFTAGQKAKAAEVNENFNLLASALNGLFDMGVVRANEDLTLTSSLKDVPGAELELAPIIPSKVLIWSSFHFETGNTTDRNEGIGEVLVDGNPLEPEARNDYDGDVIGASGGVDIDLRRSFGEFYVVTLSAAAHTIKLQARKGSNGGGTCHEETGFLWLLLPDPEP